MKCRPRPPRFSRSTRSRLPTSSSSRHSARTTSVCHGFDGTGPVGRRRRRQLSRRRRDGARSHRARPLGPAVHRGRVGPAADGPASGVDVAVTVARRGHVTPDRREAGVRTARGTTERGRTRGPRRCASRSPIAPPERFFSYRLAGEPSHASTVPPRERGQDVRLRGAEGRELEDVAGRDACCARIAGAGGAARTVRGDGQPRAVPRPPKVRVSPRAHRSVELVQPRSCCWLG